MNKSLLNLCLTLSIVSIALGQQIDTAAMKKFGDLMSEINTTLSQQCLITMGVNGPLGCAKNYEHKYLPNITKIASSVGDAAKNGSFDRISYLSKQLVQLSCCGSWSMMDCMIGITKVCFC